MAEPLDYPLDFPPPNVGDFLVYVQGCGDDDIYPSRDEAVAAAMVIQDGDKDFPVFVVQVVEIV